MNGDNGLNIDEESFMSMKTKEQMLCLYKNQVETIKLVRGYKFNQKVQYIMVGLLSTGLVTLLWMHIAI